jgi:hypothetical protein
MNSLRYLPEGDGVGCDQRGRIRGEVGDHLCDFVGADDVDQRCAGGNVLSHGVGDPSCVGDWWVHYVGRDPERREFEGG